MTVFCCNDFELQLKRTASFDLRAKSGSIATFAGLEKKVQDFTNQPLKPRINLVCFPFTLGQNPSTLKPLR